MEIRVMGTEEECELARSYYRALEESPNVKSVSVSRRYPNRGSNTLYRVYIKVEYYDVAEAPCGSRCRDELDELHRAIRTV